VRRFVIGIGLTAFSFSGCAPAPQLPKEIRKEISRLEREHRLAEEAAKSGAHPPVPRLPELPAGMPPPEVRKKVQAALRELLEFRQALAAANRPEEGGLAEEKLELRTASAEAVVALAPPEGASPQSIRIENLGPELLRDPRLQINESADWFDQPSLLAGALKPGMTDRAKAVALWQFVVAARQHGRPAHPSAELHEPVKFLNVYGAGFCDDAAAVLAELARAAGLPARIWDLAGHVVPEIYFDGKWNLLDPDGEVCYYEDDGVTFCDVESLQRDPDRIRRFPSPLYQNAEELIRIYGTGEDNRLSDFHERPRGPAHRMAYSLRPGESLTRSRRPGNHYFSAGYFEPPPELGSGQLTFVPVFREDQYRVGCAEARGLQASAGHLETISESAEWAYAFELPYPMLAGRVRLDCDLPEGGVLELSLSEDGKNWTHSAVVREGGRRERAFRLNPFFRNGYGDPVYGYMVRFRLRLPPGARAEIYRAEFQTDIQVAPRSLPRMEAGENRVRFRQSGNTLAQVTFTDFLSGEPRE